MTSQVLISAPPAAALDHSLNATQNQIPCCEAQQVQQSNGQQHAASSVADAMTTTRKLPYQASHQAELLHLQAEVDALLVQLQTLKQRQLVESK